MGDLAVADARRRFWGGVCGRQEIMGLETPSVYRPTMHVYARSTRMYVRDLYLGLFCRVLVFGALRRVRFRRGKVKSYSVQY